MAVVVFATKYSARAWCGTSAIWATVTMPIITALTRRAARTVAQTATEKLNQRRRRNRLYCAQMQVCRVGGVCSLGSRHLGCVAPWLNGCARAGDARPGRGQVGETGVRPQ